MSEPSLPSWLTVGPARETSTIHHYTTCVLIIAMPEWNNYFNDARVTVRARNAANYYDKLTTIDTLLVIHTEKLSADL